MITILLKIFSKNKLSENAAYTRKMYGLICGALGIALNIILFAFKIFAGIFSASIAVTADAFNNLSDALSSVITLAGFKLSGQKADSEHPFGHGRLEYVSGFVVSMLIILMGVEIAKSSVKKIFKPEAVEFSVLIALILGVSILVKLYMVFYNKKVAKIIKSPALSATAADSLGDSVSTAAVLISMLITHYSGINTDAYCGIAVSLFILYSGFKAAKETLNPLLGQAPDANMVREIYSIVLRHEKISGIHDLIVHDYGPGRRMISLHAEVPEDANILETHDLIDNIEAELAEKLGCEAIIHMDPLATDDEETARIKERVALALKQISSEAGIHDFRLVCGSTHTNLIFDIVVPFSLDMDDDEIKAEVGRIVKGINEKYNAVVKVDREYI